MTYELAKELKDAEFPQAVRYGDTFYNASGVRYNISDSDAEDGTTGGFNPALGRNSETALPVFVKEPTLSELIEACQPMKADDFCLRVKQDIWEACLIYYGYFDYPEKFKDDEGFVSINLCEEGETPEEAVARLWLALNKT